MNQNIFDGVEQNYIEIQAGMYDCKINYCVNYQQGNYDVIEFFVSYIDNGQEKNISIKYIFSIKSKDKTMRELLEVLYLKEQSIFNDKDLISELYSNKDMLFKYCKHLENTWLKLRVDLNLKSDGSVYKSLRLN